MPAASGSRARRMSISPSQPATGRLSSTRLRTTTIARGDRADPFRAEPFRADPFCARLFRPDAFRADAFRADPFRADPSDRHARLQGRAARSGARTRSRLLLGAGRPARAAARAYAAERLRVGPVVGQRRNADPDPRPALFRRPDDGVPASAHSRGPPHATPADEYDCPTHSWSARGAVTAGRPHSRRAADLI